ncbi:hypothetical protein [Anaerocolumna sp.]|uniref:hypothetical protein n=1 Tax=Anaerocolumna sp. TaxID=2041569 RepID=UPI0028AA3146|nr:hypothetical protein [Anaerocolumna sp.]
MNIELMKKLEDLKKVSGTLNSKLGEQIKLKKDNFIQSVRNDFANFFKEKDFQIDSENLSITATYGSLIACLSHEKPETNFIGCYFVFNMNLKSFNNKEYSIILSKGVPSISFNVSSSARSKDDELQKEIEAIQKTIDEAQKRLDNFSQEEWKLFIKNEDAAQNNLVGEGFSSMSEILSSLIE